MNSKTFSNERRAPVEVIRNVYQERKKKNGNYSLTAYARDLGLSASHLSRVLSGGRSLTLRQGMQIAAVLEFSAGETNLFILSIVESASDTAKISKKVREKIQSQASLAAENASLPFESPLYINYDIERFKTISQWYHLAILNLTYTQGFSPTPAFVAKRLGISTIEAKGAMDRLVELGFLEESIDGKLRKTQANIYFKTERSEFAMREFQSSMMQKATDEMKKSSNEDFSRRLINSITFACAEDHVSLLKQKISDLQDEFLALTKSGPHQEVYQFNCQLFPLTQMNRHQEKNK